MKDRAQIYDALGWIGLCLAVLGQPFVPYAYTRILYSGALGYFTLSLIIRNPRNFYARCGFLFAFLGVFVCIVNALFPHEMLLTAAMFFNIVTLLCEIATERRAKSDTTGNV